jgi:hypothetical protein
VPDAEEVALPFCTRVSPLADTLTLLPPPDALDDESVAEESEVEGLAETTPGVAVAAAIPRRYQVQRPTRRPGRYMWRIPSSSLFFLSAPLLDAGGAVDARRRESASSANITLGASATALSMSCRNGGRRVRFTLRDRNRRLHAVGPRSSAPLQFRPVSVRGTTQSRSQAPRVLP